MRARLVPAALFVGALLIVGFNLLVRMDPFDEGLLLAAARRVGDGQVPYRDFLWSYGPAEPYLLAGIAKVLGASLLWWRVLWALACAGVAVAVHALVRRSAGPRWALAAWLTAACGIADPRSANPFAFALLASLCALLVAGGEPSRRRALAAGLLVALAAAFRIDFALYALVAVAVALALAARSIRPALEAAAATVAGILLVQLPFLIAAGPGQVYDSLVSKSLREREYWTLPFPWAYHGPSPTSAKGLKHLLDFYVPALLLAGLALAVVAAVVRTLRERRPPALTAGTLVFALGLLSYLLSRTDPSHTLPLIAVLAALLPALAAWALSERPPLGPALAAASVAVLALLLAHGVADRASALFHPPVTTELGLPVADGVRVRPAEAQAVERAVALVHARVPPGEPIYVATARSDLVRLSDPLFYVLADRDNATDRDFGLIARAGTQRRIVRQLDRVRPRAIVRWTDPLGYGREPNLRGRPSGVHTLDRWLARNYRVTDRLYHYEVLAPR